MLEHIGVEGNLDIRLDTVEAPQWVPTVETTFQPTWTDLEATYTRPPLGDYELLTHPSATGTLPTRDLHLVPTHLRRVTGSQTHLPPALETSVAFGDIHYPTSAGRAAGSPSRAQDGSVAQSTVFARDHIRGVRESTWER